MTNKMSEEIQRHLDSLETMGHELVVESHILTDRQVPVLLCYPKGATKLPVVFLNHGTTCDATSMLPMGLPLAQAGFFTVLVDARFHGRRRLEHFNETFFNRAMYKRLYLQMLLDTVDDISAIIDDLQTDERADAERVGISGISQGGFVSFVAITREKRIKAAAPLVASPDLTDTWGHSLPFVELESDLQEEILRHSPLRNYEAIPPVALLVQNGNADPIVPVGGVRKLNEHLKELYKEMPERYRYIEYDGRGHETVYEGSERPNIMREEVIDWFRRFLHSADEAGIFDKNE
ncbi:alpha/beta hydrolase family protein [Paenibacillus ferrarius]|uniref:alpha/beta hydrolase family protein n=1 Tax=Paenibacillus ferrarius TaxID=1469647 RepID=UPI003D266269